jgi:Mg/Co/Ni transporter MgtE
MTLSTTDDEVADALDLLARSASRLRRVLPRMSPEQHEALADCSPWEDNTEGVLIQLDTWAVVAAACLRQIPSMIESLGA